MRLFYGILLAVLVAAVLWSKLSSDHMEAKPEVEKPQEVAPTQPPAADAPSPFTDDYDAAMKETERKVVLVFSSDRCPICDVLKKNLKEIDMKGFLVCIVDADKHGDVCKKHKVRRLPTSILIEKGEETDRTRAFSKSRYEGWLSKQK